MIHCDGALDSFQDALKRVSPSGKQKSLRNQMIAQIQRLADGDEMSQQHFRREGQLPNLMGQHGTNYFYALKRIPIRGYCWKSSKLKNTYFISHYIFKNFNDLHSSDTEIVINNWRKIEEGTNVS